MAIRSSCSKSMGELLLRGYAMLADTCPDCQVPLMRDPSTRACLCVNCDAQYKDGVRISPPAPNTPDASETDTTPSGAPSSQPQDTRHRLRLSTGAHAEEPPSPTANARQATVDMAQATDRQSSDDVAEEISQKLLAGWALVDAHCPRCSTPLVREKATRRMYCCGCSMWVLTEQQAAAAAASTPAPSSAEVAAALPLAASPNAPVGAPTVVPSVQGLADATSTVMTPAAATVSGQGALLHEAAAIASGTVVSRAAALGIGPAATRGAALRAVKQEGDEAHIQGIGVVSDFMGAVNRAQLSEARHAALADLESVVVQRLREVTQVLVGSECAVAHADVGSAERLDRMLKLASSCVSVLDQLGTGHL